MELWTMPKSCSSKCLQGFLVGQQQRRDLYGAIFQSISGNRNRRQKIPAAHAEFRIKFGQCHCWVQTAGLASVLGAVTKHLSVCSLLARLPASPSCELTSKAFFTEPF